MARKKACRYENGGFVACAPREDRQCVSASDAISAASFAGCAAGSSSDIARARARGRVRP